MPVYDYKCEKCGNEFEIWAKVENRYDIDCKCGNRASKILSTISKPIVMEYYSESLGAYITGPRQKQRIMKEKNVSEAG